MLGGHCPDSSSMAEWLTRRCDFKAGKNYPKGQKLKWQNNHSEPTEDTEQDNKATPRSLRF